MFDLMLTPDGGMRFPKPQPDAVRRPGRCGYKFPVGPESGGASTRWSSPKVASTAADQPISIRRR